MTFNKKEYLETFDGKNRLDSLIRAYNDKPHSNMVRQAISAELYKNPSALIGATQDVVDNYLNTDVSNRFENKKLELYGLTELNLDKIIDDLTSKYESAGDALGLVINLPSHKPRGGRYKGLSDAHLKAQEAQMIYSNKDLKSVIGSLLEDYGLSEESLAYHAKADSESLIRIFGETVVNSRLNKLGEKLSTEEGKLDKSKTSDFAKYLVDKAENEKRNYALDIVSKYAFDMYKPKKEE